MELEDAILNIEAMAFDLDIAAPDIGSGKGKAYECWVMLELAVRLRQRGVTVTAVNPEGVPVTNFRLRRAPGQMPAYNPDAISATERGDQRPTMNEDRPSHFCFYKSENRKFELHIGLQCKGASESPHELDLCVLPQENGERLRSGGGGYYEEVIELGIELKAYNIKHKLGHNIPRALMGVVVDLDPTWLFPHALMHTAGRVEILRTRNRQVRYGLLTTTRLYNSSLEYLDHHGVLAGGPVLPGTNEAILHDITDHLERLL